MDLWTEFEGVTIDSAFSLEKLLQTEGRSAFFSTFNSKGESVLIRIIECHFDEDEILARWRGVQALAHPSFLRIDRFGQFLIEADDITAVYAVFERVDANLGEVLDRGRLSATDASQIGLTIASALETLHAHGFVHEHLAAGNIYAVGESVKLRSDCIRETPEGEAGIAARRRDIHDLAQVLVQVLLGARNASYAARQSALPVPFEDVVRNAMSGEWGLTEIKAALTLQKGLRVKAAAVQAAPAAAPAKVRDAAPDTFSAKKAAQPEPHAARPTFADAAAFVGSSGYGRARFRVPAPLSSSHPLFRRWLAAAAFVVVIAVFGWIFAHRVFGHRSAEAAQPVAAAHSTTAPRRTPPAAQAGSSQPTSASAGTARGRSDWRVVAFTYNHENQAQKKAASLMQKHPDLRPEVFSPTGRAPWLVTVGGVQQRDAAYALARRAGSLGLPRDTYAQNYTGR
jgi:hypothetical protein